MTSTLKQSIKGTLQSLSASSSIQPIVITSMGRSGSTLVYDAVVDAVIAASPLRRITLSRKLTADWSWTLGEKTLRQGTVYKTHDYPEQLAQTKAKCLFLFGSCLDAATSVHSSMTRFGSDWVAKHFKHLKSDGAYENIFDSDVQGFENQIRTWATTKIVPTLCLRFDGLWGSQLELSEFLGLDVKLPPRRPRKTKNYDPDVTTALEKVYGPIDERTAKLPDCFVSGAEIEKYF